MGITRRQFLELAGASAAGAVFSAGCQPRDGELLVESPANLPESLAASPQAWYASVCQMCPAGCGISVWVVEGRARKIEGNPNHPVNMGKLSSRGQAGLQLLYNPDRIQGPLRRTGPRGSGQFEPISWEDGLTEVLGRLKELQEAERLDQLMFVTDRLTGHLAMLMSRFARSAEGVRWISHEPLEETVLKAMLGSLPGQEGRAAPPQLPYFDIANSSFVISFGADFLTTWISPVQYGVAYGRFRGRPEGRGVLIQVEPRMTATGASADRWIPIRPGTEGFLALGMAQVIVAEGLVSQAAAAATGFTQGSEELERYRPEAVAELTGVPEEQIVDLARRFASQTPSLAIGGGPAAAHTNGRFNLAAIYSLNLLVGNIGQPGGIIPNPPPPLPEIGEAGAVQPSSFWNETAQTAGGAPGQMTAPQVLLVRGANPLYDLPPSLGLQQILEQVPFIASFSSFIDETTAMADLVLPGHTYLEDWGTHVPNPGPGFPVVGFQQPVVNPFYDTRSFGDILLTLAGEMGFNQEIPWGSFQEMIREGARELFGQRGGSVEATSFEEFWIRLLMRGAWWNEQAEEAVTPGIEPPGPVGPAEPSFAGSEDEYPFHLLPFPTPSLREGNGAQLPWLQATPEPITTAVWMTWIELNPMTAQQLGLEQGDVVRVESTIGALEAAVYPHPAIHPDVVAIPMGRGHNALGRYAREQAGNPFTLLAPLAVDDTGVLAWAATRVKLTKTGEATRVLRAEGSVMPFEPEDVDLIQTVSS